MSDEDWIKNIHARGGDCDQQRDKLWHQIRTVNVKQVHIALKIEGQQ